MLDLPKEPIVISDTKTDENKALEQHPVKVLPNDELELIKNNQMLTDTSINLAEDILGTQFKMKDRFQDTILDQKLMFKPKEHFVQILHNKSFHWVTVSNVNSKSGSVDYYDSLFHGRIKDHVKLQIANVSKTENSELEIHIRSCQEQKNGVDCGIFVVANAYYILNGIDVSSIRTDENKMRAKVVLKRSQRSKQMLTLFSHLKVLLLWKYFADVECRVFGTILKTQL